jgi:deoxyribonuclease V
VTYPDFEPVETVVAERATPFPYIPGLLSFREGPVLLEAFGRLGSEPDIFLFDGMGIAHPRRIGIASHLGLWLGRPTIGCGKTLLCGRYGELGEQKGAAAPLVDKGETIGMALRTRTAKNPMFISPGHLADVPTAAELVLRCAPKYRLPEPIRLAHNAAGRFTP